MTRPFHPHLVVVLAAVLSAGCLPVRSSSGPSLSTRADLAGSSSMARVVGAAELGTVHDASLFQALTILRPELLRRHGGGRPERPGGDFAVVYLDGHRQGELEMLHSIPAAMVIEVRFLTPTEAASRFGTLHPGGVIAVRTRR